MFQKENVLNAAKNATMGMTLIVLSVIYFHLIIYLPLFFSEEKSETVEKKGKNVLIINWEQNMYMATLLIAQDNFSLSFYGEWILY